MADSNMCYAIRYTDKPGYGIISADIPEMANDNAKMIAKALRKGGTVERVTTLQAKEGMLEYYKATGAIK